MRKIPHQYCLEFKEENKDFPWFLGLRRCRGGDGLVRAILAFLSSPSTINKAAAGTGPGLAPSVLLKRGTNRVKFTPKPTQAARQDCQEAFVSPSLR